MAPSVLGEGCAIKMPPGQRRLQPCGGHDPNLLQMDFLWHYITTACPTFLLSLSHKHAGS